MSESHNHGSSASLLGCQDLLELLTCSEPLLGGGGLGIRIVDTLEIDLTSRHALSLGRVGGTESCRITLEFGHLVGLEAQITPLHDRRLVSLGGHDISLVLQSLRGEVLNIRILHPVHREEITKARSNARAIHHGITSAVGAPRRLGWAGCT